MELRNIFESIPTDLNDEVFEQLVQSENITIERIVSNGHRSPESGWYDQGRNEWIIILKGEAIITFETDKKISLSAGSYLNIPPHTKHRVSWTSPETETIWLAVHYD